MSKASYLPEALADLREIWRFLVNAAQSFDIADRFVRDLDATCQLRATQPFAGELRSDLGEHVRAFSFGSYVVLYLPLRDGIEVIQLIHGSRDISTHFRGLPGA